MTHSSPGDPEGRRIAKKKASLLAEAGQVARVLSVLVQRAGHDDERCTQLIRSLAKEEQKQLQKSHGRIESRKRFKPHSSNPVRENRPPSFLYIDENGKSGIEPNVKGPSFFALTAVAMVEEDIAPYCVAADQIKTEFFGRTDLTFHEPYMRNREGPYGFGGDENRQQEFDEALEQLVEKTNFVAFGVGVRKDAFVEDFVKTEVDPYLPTDVYALSIIMLLERYIDFLSSSEVTRFGKVTFESQGPKEDAYHQLEYARTLLDGSQWVPESAFRSWLETGLRFTPKQGSEPMELADMFSRDLYEWVRSEGASKPKRWEQFSRKIHCRGDGKMGKFGVKVFPDSDIRNIVEKHREEHGVTT